MRKYRALTAVGLILIGAIATVGSAKRLGTAAPVRLAPAPERLGNEHYRFLRFIHKLDLTRQQVQEIQTILQDNQAQLEADRTAVVQARCAYDQGVITGASDLTTLAANLATAQANHTALTTTVLQQITADLTPSQITTIAGESCTGSSATNE